MKSSELKKLIKESVKEAIQEELKEILLEAVKTPKVITQPSTMTPVVETQTPQQPVMTASEKITVWGTGEEQRDFLYVKDLVDLIENSIINQKYSYELVNASYGKSISIDNLVKTIVEISGKDSAKLVQLMTCRDLSKSKVGKCYYAPLIDETYLFLFVFQLKEKQHS